MGRNGRGCRDVHPGDVGVYGIVDVLGDTSLLDMFKALLVLGSRRCETLGNILPGP